MNNSDKKQKIIKIAIIAVSVFFGVFIILILISQRPQNAGTGNASVGDFNARIDYHDEMNCRVGDKKDNSSFVVAAKDGWNEAVIENFEIDGQKTNLHVIGDKIYVDKGGDKKAYNIAYFNYEYSLDFPNSLMLSSDDSRKIRCSAQDEEVYQIGDLKNYEDISWKKVPNEENK